MKYLMGCIVSVLLIANVEANIIKSDWEQTGDELISIDTAANLAWLSPSLFFGMTWNDVENLLQNDPAYSGYRFATGTEYGSLLGPQGLDILGYASVISSERGERFINHFSLESVVTTYDFFEFQFGTPVEVTTSFSYVLFSGVHVYPDGRLFIADFANPYGFQPDSSSEARSYFLVKEVPEPPTLLLFVFGIVVSFLFRKTKS